MWRRGWLTSPMGSVRTRRSAKRHRPSAVGEENAFDIPKSERVALTGCGEVLKRPLGTPPPAHIRGGVRRWPEPWRGGLGPGAFSDRSTRDESVGAQGWAEKRHVVLFEDGCDDGSVRVPLRVAGPSSSYKRWQPPGV